MQLFLEENFFQKVQVFFQKNVLRFLSLRYGADFRRSRLVGIVRPFFPKLFMSSMGPLFG